MSLGHPAGQTGVDRPVSQGFLDVYFCRLTLSEKVIGTGVPGTPPRPGRFSDILCDFSYVPFLLPTLSTGGV